MKNLIVKFKQLDNYETSLKDVLVENYKVLDVIENLKLVLVEVPKAKFKECKKKLEEANVVEYVQEEKFYKIGD